MVLRDHTPVHAGIRSPNECTLEQDRRTTVNQWGINDIRMPDNPPDIGSGPIDFARLNVIDAAHRPVERDEITAIVAHDSLRLSCSAGRIQNVKGIRRRHKRAIMWHCNDGLGNHGHVDDHAITFRDAEQRESTGALRNAYSEFAECEGLDRLRYRTVINQRYPVAVAICDVPVDGVIARIDFRAGEPSVERLIRVVEDLLPLLVPMDFFGCFGPKTYWIID